jgi:hypothetical protein
MGHCPCGLRWSSPPIHADDVTEWQRRTEGQIRDVIRPIEEGRDGAGVVTQLAACPEHSAAPYLRSPRAGCDGASPAPARRHRIGSNARSCSSHWPKQHRLAGSGDASQPPLALTRRRQLQLVIVPALELAHGFDIPAAYGHLPSRHRHQQRRRADLAARRDTHLDWPLLGCSPLPRSPGRSLATWSRPVSATRLSVGLVVLLAAVTSYTAARSVARWSVADLIARRRPSRPPPRTRPCRRRRLGGRPHH